ncbi:MAG: peptidase U32 [Desulfuromonadaceae bacterium]|nr:peptidase U32 [Desulfuromonadaceae bacterium]
MFLSVAANFDSKLIPRLAEHHVHEVYGKFPSDLVGGGRPSYMGTPLSFRKLRRYVADLKKYGIAFNYLLNSSCLGNREWDGRWQRNLCGFLNRLDNAGVERVTVATPYLLELIKIRFPQFQVKAGIYAQIDTPERARFWEDLGADALTLESFSINRDFKRLTRIREAVSCELQLIANHLCLPNCPMQPYHQNGFSHASDGSRNLYLDYCFLKCTLLRLKEPMLFVRSAWIRPEDLPEYEKIGYTSFKLLERGIPSENLLQRVEAYGNRSFSGNLADLFLSHGFRQPLKREPGWLLRHFLHPRSILPWRLKPLVDLARRQGMLFQLQNQPIIIHSDRIPGDFIDRFRNGSCAGWNCRSCGRCSEIARDAVEIKPDYLRESLLDLDNGLHALASGSLWNA